MKAEVFQDVVDGADGSTIVVMSRIHMLATEEGGLDRPVYPKYRPNHNFGDANNLAMYIGQVEISEGGCINPGETKELVIRFLNARSLEEQLVPGKTWRIQHGTKLIANAEVLQVVGKIQPKK